MSTIQRKGIPKVRLVARIPEDVSNRVSLALMDPLRGKPQYGSISVLVTELLVRWLATLSQEPPANPSTVEDIHDV